MKLVATAAFVALAMLLPPPAAAASEWDEYLESEFQNFVWDDEVRAGYEAYAAQDYETAAKALTKAIDKGCKDPLVVFRAGYALRAAGDADAAAGYFKAATERFAEARTDHRCRADAHFYLADFYLKHGQYDEAEWELEHAVTLRDDFTEAYLLYGDLFAAQGKYHFAAEKYRLAHEKDPKSVKPLLNLAVALFRDNRYAQAKAALDTARTLEPDNDRIGLMAATLAVAAHDLRTAGAEYAAIHERNPESVDALLGLGYVAWHQGRFDEAAKHYAAILDLEPDHVDALYGLAIAEAKEGQIDDAVKRLRRVIELEPDHKNAHYNLGSLYQNQGDYEAAIKQYARVIELDPDDHTPSYNLGVIFIRLKRYPEAQEYLEQAVKAFGKTSRWGRAAQKLLDLVIQIQQDRAVEIDKELEKLEPPGPENSD